MGGIGEVLGEHGEAIERWAAGERLTAAAAGVPSLAEELAAVLEGHKAREGARWFQLFAEVAPEDLERWAERARLNHERGVALAEVERRAGEVIAHLEARHGAPAWREPSDAERRLALGGYWHPAGVMLDTAPLAALREALERAKRAGLSAGENGV